MMSQTLEPGSSTPNLGSLAGTRLRGTGGFALCLGFFICKMRMLIGLTSQGWFKEVFITAVAGCTWNSTGSFSLCQVKDVKAETISGPTEVAEVALRVGGGGGREWGTRR